MTLGRKILGALSFGALAMGLASGTANAEDKVIRIGYQKYGNVILLKNSGTLEGTLKPLGYKVEWSEFPSGPPLLEALNAGAIDFGHAGEAPPIFEVDAWVIWDPYQASAEVATGARTLLDGTGRASWPTCNSIWHRSHLLK